MAEAASTPQPVRGNIARWAAIALTMFVAACSSGPRVIPAPARPVPVERPPERPPERPITAALPQDVERHRVALLVPLSGPNAGLGRSLQNATQLAILDTNTDVIRITTYDTSTGAAAAANQAIADGNRLILGPLLAEDAREVAPIARRARVPVISFSNDTSAAGNGTYLLGHSPAQSIERVVEYARSTGVTTFAGLMPTGLYGERASTAFLRAVERVGGTVSSMQTYDGRQGSMTGAITRLGASPYQAVLIATPPNNALTAVPLIRRNGGRSARVLGTELWNTDSALGSNAVLNGAWFASVPDTLYRQYATKYRARFNVAPWRLSAMGYDAVLLTVRVAREWKPGDEFPERLLTRSFGGVDGAFRFGRDGIAERALEVQEISGGTTVTKSPAPTNIGD